MTANFAFIALSIFTTVEFYVIVCVVAASVIALLALPERKGEVKVYMLAGDLTPGSGIEPLDTGPGHGSLACHVRPGNIVTLTRRGLQGIYSNGAVSIVIKVSGFDITIEERITPGGGADATQITEAVFNLDFLAPEWYHIRYESDYFSEHASFTLHVRQGITITKPLIH